MKNCSRCFVMKPFEEFHRRSAMKCGYASWCKQCRSMYDKKQVLTPEGKRQKRNRQYMCEYGITVDQVEAMWEDQGQGCAICSNPCIDVRFHVDHDHETGKIRGLLCPPCNFMLGAIRDDRAILARAIVYLEDARCAAE